MTEQLHNNKPWKQGNPDVGIIYADNGDGKFDTVVAITEMHAEDTEANARRIVACVNACAGYGTDALEALAQREGFKNLVEYGIGLDAAIKQRDNAWLELRQIREAIKANPEESTFDEVARVVSQGDLLLSALELAEGLLTEEFGGIASEDLSEGKVLTQIRTIIAGHKAF